MFKLVDLMHMEIGHEPDPKRVALFYAQSASVVGFLINQRGGEAFGSFCRSLRDGKPVDAALAGIYPDDFPSVDLLEQKWLKSLSP